LGAPPGKKNGGTKSPVEKKKGEAYFLGKRGNWGGTELKNGERG